MRFILIFFFLAEGTAFSQQLWVLKKDADSIKVFTSHHDSSQYKSVKAVFTVNASLSQLAAMVWQVEHYNQWQYNTLSTKILKRISDREMIYYAEINAPWPISNRDMVVRMRFHQDLQTKVLTIDSDSEPAFVPEVEGIVRVPSSHAKWVVTPRGLSKLDVVYTIQIDPGGSVPAWMVNMVCAEAPHESFVNLRNMIQYVASGPAAFVIE